MPFEYTLTLLALLLIALVIKYKFKITIFKSTSQALVFFVVIFIIGTIWDNFAVWRGHWYYPGQGITGVFVGLIPIEDYLFAIVTSYTVLVLYKAVITKVK